MEKQKNKNGITLVALIITVIVMMILIGVTISLITSNDLTRVAENAVGQYENQMRIEGNLGEIEVDGKTYPSVEAYLQKLSGEIPWIYEENEDGTITITGIDFTIFESSGDRPNYATANMGIETLVFPTKLDGKTVVAVDWKDLIIPVDNIVAGDYADITLPGIKKVIFSDTIKYLDAGYNTAEDEDSFKFILPDAEEVILPNGLEEIGDRFFSGWGWDEENRQSNLELEIPASVRTIEGYAFNLIKKVYLKPGKFTENDVDTAGRWGANEVIIDYAFEIGDYVNYNPTIADLNGTPVDNDEIYYKSLAANNGFVDQEFQATTSVKWRILDYSLTEGTITLISEYPINSITDEPLTFMGMGAENELNTICSIYGHGYGAISAVSFGGATGFYYEKAGIRS